MTNLKEIVTLIYYGSATISIILVAVRLLYTWFKDFDNSQRFITDMAQVHLPYIYDCFEKIGKRLDVPLDERPIVNFSLDRTHQA